MSSTIHQNKNSIPRISNPQRLLILTPNTHSQNTVPSFLQSLTGVAVSPQELYDGPASKEDESQETQAQTTFAGYTTHAPLQLTTKYYSADIPIWVDEIPIPATTTTSPSSPLEPEHHHPSPSPSTWSTGFLAPPAAEVRSAIGALLILLLRKPVTTVSSSNPAIIPRRGGEASGVEREQGGGDVAALKEVVRAAAEVKRKIDGERGGSGGGVPGMVVLVGEEAAGLEMVEYGGVRWWDEELAEMGIYEFEVVGWDAAAEGVKRRNEFGELEGMPRIREVLETNEWTMDLNGEGMGDAVSGLGELEGEGLDLEVGELEREMLGLRMAIEKGGDDGVEGEWADFDEDDLKVEQLEGLMLRVQAIRDMGADLPGSERRKFAAKAIGDIMKDL
ncbi:hypothetical protein PRK78_007213 [Emydomyces testavorans]|uniref:Alpha and gamma adaptin binding protein p34 n=1 Tax=Emydomyces testavorans TaxID=2070801 RepID=A0AAF0DMV8_9EURO|nr:hypothetical protein PRK78_007213 [Emydomyces testavorans]